MQYTKTCGPKDLELIDRVGNKHKHSSTLERLVYAYDIEGVSRALLQELARHRMASLSVKSTRYTLKELKDETPFCAVDETNRRVVSYETYRKRASKYLVFTGVEDVDISSIIALENLRQLIRDGIANDKAKFALPDSYKTQLTYTINARSLQNFLTLRTGPSAMWEIQDLANAMFEALPEDHKYLFDMCIYSEDTEAGKIQAQIDALQLKLSAIQNKVTK